MNVIQMTSVHRGNGVILGYVAAAVVAQVHRVKNRPQMRVLFCAFYFNFSAAVRANSSHFSLNSSPLWPRTQTQ